MLSRPVLVILAAREEFLENKNKVFRLFSFAKVLRAHNHAIARMLVERYGDALFVDPHLYVSKKEALNILERGTQNER